MSIRTKIWKITSVDNGYFPAATPTAFSQKDATKLAEGMARKGAPEQEVFVWELVSIFRKGEVPIEEIKVEGGAGVPGRELKGTPNKTCKRISLSSGAGPFHGKCSLCETETQCRFEL